jgi:hypothetical protein
MPSDPSFGGRRLRVAVIGAGHIARVGHLPALRELEAAGELELVAAADIDAAAARAFAADAGVPAVFGDPDELLAATAPNLVIIGSPPGTHREQAVAASFAYAEELVLEPGETLDLRYRVVVADGVWEREQIDEYVEAHPW